MVALSLRPLPELQGVSQVEACEEGARIEGDRPLQLPGGESGAEVGYIARGYGGVQPELGGTEDKRRLPQVATQGEQRLIERVARPFRVALGPEEESQRIAAHPGLGCGEHGQQGQWAPASLGPAEHFARVRLDGEAAERAKSQKKDSLLTGF
jgi:hypothetical protein